MIAILGILGFLTFCVFIVFCFDRQVDKVDALVERQKRWMEFYDELKVLNGTEVSGRTFWINTGEVVSWGNKCYDVGNYDLCGKQFYIELGREVDDDWYDSEGVRHSGCKLVGTFVIYGELPEK